MASPTSAHEDSENLSLDGNEVVDIFSDIRELDVVDGKLGSKSYSLH